MKCIGCTLRVFLLRRRARMWRLDPSVQNRRKFHKAEELLILHANTKHKDR